MLQCRRVRPYLVWFASPRVLRLKRKIASLTVFTLAVAIVKIALEFQMALPAAPSPAPDLAFLPRRAAPAPDPCSTSDPCSASDPCAAADPCTNNAEQGGALSLLASHNASRPISSHLILPVVAVHPPLEDQGRWRSNVSLFLQGEPLRGSSVPSFLNRNNQFSLTDGEPMAVASNEGAAQSDARGRKELNNDLTRSSRIGNSLDPTSMGNYSWPHLVPVPPRQPDSDVPSASSASRQRPQSQPRTLTAQPFLVIMVCSKPENTELRLTIRRTWGLDLDPSKVVVRFFVGQQETWDSITEREHALHGDVVMTEYLDTYENLSYKVLAAFSWSLAHVKTAQYIMKTDDDTYVNLPYLLHELRHNSRRLLHEVQKRGGDVHRYVMGAVCEEAPVVREEGDKWFVSELDYPGEVYPRYVFGGGYVTTRGAAEALLAASLQADYLPLEDVYLTGILARMAEVTLVSHPGFAYWTSKRASPCDVVAGRRMTSVNMTPKQFSQMYSGIHAILRAGNWTKC